MGPPSLAPSCHTGRTGGCRVQVVGRFFNDIGLPRAYFELNSADGIAKHILSLEGASRVLCMFSAPKNIRPRPSALSPNGSLHSAARMPWPPTKRKLVSVCLQLQVCSRVFPATPTTSSCSRRRAIGQGCAISSNVAPYSTRPSPPVPSLTHCRFCVAITLQRNVCRSKLHDNGRYRRACSLARRRAPRYAVASFVTPGSAWLP